MRKLLSNLVNDTIKCMDIVSGFCEVFGNFYDSVTIVVRDHIFFDLHKVRCPFYIYALDQKLVSFVIPYMKLDAAFILCRCLWGLGWLAEVFLSPMHNYRDPKLIYQPLEVH